MSVIAFGFGIEAGDARAAVHLGEARRVPELGREIAIAFDALRRELDVASLRRHGRQREAQRIGAIVVDEVQGVDDIALRLRHFRALLVTDERVDIDVAEGDLFLEMEAHHHHAGDPEEDDVEAGDQHIGRIVAMRAPGVSSGQPSVENGQSAEENQVSSTSSSRVSVTSRAVLGARAAASAACFALLDEDIAVFGIPGRNVMAPPELARDAPGLDVLQPVEIGLLPILRHEDRCGPSRTAASAGCARVLASTYHWSVRHGSSTAPERSPCGTICLWSDLRRAGSRSSIIATIARARGARGRGRASASTVMSSSGEGATCSKNASLSCSVTRAFGVEHIDQRQAVPSADLEIVEVMRRA